MKKLFTAILAICFWATTAWAMPLQQPVFDKELDVVTYMGDLYYYDSHKMGTAGYKTIDDMAYLLRTNFLNAEGDEIHMIEIITQKKELEIVGFGFNIQGEKYAIEDSDCDGVFDKVERYNSSVFPPDCFHPTKGLKDAFKI